ncbi:YgaP family membrane protein [Brevibacillus fluminis]|uniref:YgaP family membrane protein n=1 Tax=Brevibacillus fluminis TaxID=511487 RepID=UPI003F8A178C
MQKNVGTIDAVIRITFGLLGLAYGAGKMSRRPYRTPGLLMFLSAMKVAEGVTGFCPLLKMMGASTRKEDVLRMMVDKTMRSMTKGSSSGNQARANTANVTGASHPANTQQQAAVKPPSSTQNSSAPKKEMTDEMMMNMAEEITDAVVHSHHQAGSTT